MPTITGTPGNDTLPGTAGDDQIFGLAGDDTLSGLGGNDTTDGGDGNDVHLVDSASDVVVERAGEGDDTVITSVSYALGDGTWVETLRTVDAASTLPLTLIGNEIAQSIYGNAGNNVLNGGRGNDYLVGLEGNDYLIGGGGTDAMLGGTGNDTYTIDLAVGDQVTVEGGGFPVSATVIDTGDGQTVTVSQQTSGGGSITRTVQIGQLYSGDNVLESPGEGEDVIVAYTSYILRSGISVELLAAAPGSAGITLQGNELANSIYGNDGDNMLSGGAGDDFIFGGAGNDTLFGEAGLDTLAGGAGNDVYLSISQTGDRVFEAVGEGFDQVITGISYTLAPGVEVEVLSATPFTNGIVLLGGNEFTQTILGNDLANRLSGGGGPDTLNGQGGNDIYDISDGRETIVEGFNGGSDAAYVSTNYALNAGAQVETLSTYWQYGNAGYDISGNDFGQTIIGDFGSNILDGKGAADTLVGLGGADTFAFTTALGSGNVDTIQDFEGGIDTIALDDAIFTTLAPGDLDPEAFATGTAATEADDRIIYDPATGNLFYDADGSGAGAAVLFAHLNNAPTVQATDFSVI
jgi:serralysin